MNEEQLKSFLGFDTTIESLMGMNKTNEILNLWFELCFLRSMTNRHLTVLYQNSDYSKEFTKSIIDDCREEARKEVEKKFPKFTIDFKKPNLQSEYGE